MPPRFDRPDLRLRNDLWRLAVDEGIPHPAFGGKVRAWTVQELAAVFGATDRLVQLGLKESRERAGILDDAC